jgi:phosphoribosylglycinamide formyltransferase-1
MSVKVGVLGSTRGTALQGVLDGVAAGSLNVEIVLVVSDKKNAPILERAERYGVRALFISPAGLEREAYDQQVSDALRQAGAELVLMIGYMRIVSARFIETWRGRMLNVHPSLLPAFGGLMNRSVHEAVRVHYSPGDGRSRWRPDCFAEALPGAAGRYGANVKGSRAGAGAGCIR